MALINCIECGKEFSDKAVQCPNCACPNENVEEINQYKPNDIKCDVEIKGYEKLGFFQMDKYGLFIIFCFFLFLVYSLIMNTSNLEFSHFIFSFFLLMFFSICIGFICSFTPSSFKKRKNAKKIYEYFKLKYPIFNEMDKSFKNVGTLNVQDKDIDQLMFQIYMKAHSLHADAIVMNIHNVITRVRTNVDITLNKNVGSETSREVMVTFIKY